MVVLSELPGSRISIDHEGDWERVNKNSVETIFSITNHQIGHNAIPTERLMYILLPDHLPGNADGRVQV